MQQEKYSEEVYGDLDWFDGPNDVKMAVYIKNRIIPVGERLACQVILWNKSKANVSANFYIDYNGTGNLKDCQKDNFKNLQPGNIAYEIWTFETRKKGIGEYEIGFYLEPRSGGYYGKSVGRHAVGALVGFIPGKSVGGFSTWYRLVKGLVCPQCDKSLSWLTKPNTGWYCRNCKGWL